MPSAKAFYGPKTLSAERLGTRIIKGKILDVKPKTMRGADGITNNRLVLTLQGEPLGIPLNAGNTEAIIEKYGDDYSKWKGKEVVVKIGKTQYNGNEVDGLIVTPTTK